MPLRLDGSVFLVEIVPQVPVGEIMAGLRLDAVDVVGMGRVDQTFQSDGLRQGRKWFTAFREGKPQPVDLAVAGVYIDAEGGA